MTPIKLENGNILNLSEIAYVDAEEGQAYFKSPVILWENDFFKKKLFSAKVTPADCDRIVATMGAGEGRSIYVDAQKLAGTDLNDLTRKQRGLSND